MGLHDRAWYGADAAARRRQRGERGDTWRLLRGLAIVAVAVMAVVVFARLLIQQRGTFSPFGASTQSSKPTSPPGPMRVFISPSTAPPSMTYRCIVDGKLVYSGPEDCRQATESTRSDRPVLGSQISNPPARDGLTEYQRQMLRSADARIARDAAAARAEMELMRQRAPVAAGECAALEAHIRALDAEARHPNSAGMQDIIRARRQEARSRQFALRCQ